MIIERMVRAYYPSYFAYTFFDDKRFRILSAEISEERPHNLPGTVFKTQDGKIAVRAKNKSIILIEVQLEGKNRCNIEDFVRGLPVFIGSVLGSK